MPIYSPYELTGIPTAGDNTGEPLGRRPMHFWNTNGMGVPRYTDLVATRVLETTHTIQLPLRTVLEQVVGTEFSIRPTVEDPGDSHLDACEAADYWFRGHFNKNRETFDHWLKQVVTDIISLDAGVTELVPEDTPQQYLAEMYARDGATFTKNPDEYGVLPEPEGLEEAPPAYYQFSLPSGITNAYMDFSGNPRKGIPAHSELFQSAYNQLSVKFSYGLYQPIEFSRDQLVWIEDNPRSWDVYGQGKVQTVQRLTEIILNQDMSNLKYFSSNEIPEGILNLKDFDETRLNRFKEDWKEEVKGNQHILPMLNGEVNWIPFRATLKDLSFIESQEWYNKLVWMCFGVSQSEVGDLGDVNRSTAEEQSIIVWRKTTLPLLKLIANYINREILPYLQVYQEAGGEIEFRWEISNPAIEAMDRKKQIEDLDNDLTTVNSIRVDRGLDPLPWGDWPKELTATLARTHPEWFLTYLGEEDVPEPLLPSLLALDAPRPSITREQDVPRAKDDDALRNEHDGSHPTQVKHMVALAEKLQKLISSRLEALKSDVSRTWPKETNNSEQKMLLINISSILNKLSLAGPMLSLIISAHYDTVEDNMEYYKRQIENEIKEDVDLEDDVEVIADIKVQDTEALEILRREAAIHVVQMEQQVKNRIRNVLVDVAEKDGNLTMALNELDKHIPEISRERAALIARTEILSASRESSQALAEATSLIAGKEWISTGGKSGDGRTRKWHAVMHGTIIPKNDFFVVPQTGDKSQPKDYPRQTKVVGGDQPFNCRCDQRPVLAKNMPTDQKSFMAKYPEIRFVKTTRKMRSKFEEVGLENENLKTMLQRYEKMGTRHDSIRELGVSKQTYYRWLADFDIV